MLSSILKAIFDFLWGKLLKGASLFYKKKKIESEVNQEEDEIKAILKEVEEYLKQNETVIVPPHLEKKLIDASRRRNNKLPV